MRVGGKEETFLHSTHTTDGIAANGQRSEGQMFRLKGGRFHRVGESDYERAGISSH